MFLHIRHKPEKIRNAQRPEDIHEHSVNDKEWVRERHTEEKKHFPHNKTSFLFLPRFYYITYRGRFQYVLSGRNKKAAENRGF